MKQLLTKLWKPAVASLAGLLLLAPAVAAAADGSYYWQSPSRAAIVTTAGSGTTYKLHAGSGDKLFTAPASSCSDGSTATGPASITVAQSDYGAHSDPTNATADDGCGNVDSVSIYAA